MIKINVENVVHVQDKQKLDDGSSVFNTNMDNEARLVVKTNSHLHD